MKKADIKKIALATRTKKDGLDACKKKLEELCNKSKIIEKIYIICDINKPSLKKIGDINCEILFDINPTKPTAFNLVLKKLNRNKTNIGQFHLLTYSKEVDLKRDHINEMIKAIEDNLIVVGYRLKNKDRVLNKEEFQEYANGSYENNDVGIAYKVPWSTCALWNKKFVYGEGKSKLKFDKICEKNALGKLDVNVNGIMMATDYEGMEDGLAIAEIITKNKTLKLKYKLFEEELDWNIEEEWKKITKHKIKMARKNIVLSTFMNIKGYSIDKLIAADLGK